jgi:hypothetical protein
MVSMERLALIWGVRYIIAVFYIPLSGGKFMR